MKKFLPILFGLCLAVLLHAQTEPNPEAVYTPAQLDQLLAPIALYPDALVALILPASTEPSDVVLAARYLEANGDPAQVDDQPWNDSVKALAHYPEVVKWMDTNLEWTKSLGAAFLQQPAEVMKAIQRLRAQARAAGTLVDTPQQDVVMEDGDICIVPAQPDVIYVPEYDPEVVYEPQTSYAGPLLIFGAGWRVGVWLNFECDWGGHGIRRGVWHPGWDWRRPHFIGNAGRPWRPDPDRERELRQHFNRPHPVIPKPRLMPGAPSAPHRPGGNFHPYDEDKNLRPDNRGAVPRDFDHRGRDDRQAAPPLPNQSRPATVAPRPVPSPAALPGNSGRGAVPHDFAGHERESQPTPPPNQSRPAAAAPRPVPPPAGLPGGYSRSGMPRDFNSHAQENRQPERPAPNQNRPAAIPSRSPPPPPSKQPAQPSGSDKDKDKDRAQH